MDTSIQPEPRVNGSPATVHAQPEAAVAIRQSGDGGVIAPNDAVQRPAVRPWHHLPSGHKLMAIAVRAPAAVKGVVQGPGGTQFAAAIGTAAAHVASMVTASLTLGYSPEHVDWGAFTSESFSNGVGYTLIGMNVVGFAGDACALVWSARDTADEQGNARPSPTRMKAGAWTAITGGVMLTAAGTGQVLFDSQLPLSFAKTAGGATATLGLTVLGGMAAIGGTVIRGWSLYRSFRPAPQAAGGQPAQVQIELVDQQAPPQGVGVLQPPQEPPYGVAVFQPEIQPAAPQGNPPGYPGGALSPRQASVAPPGDVHPQEWTHPVYEMEG